LKGELKSDGYLKQVDNSSPTLLEEEKAIPSHLASFKIDLHENEKKAKDELILPYTLYVYFIDGFHL